jgi:hypothetical protein
VSSHADDDQLSSETRVSDLTVERSALFEKASTDEGLSADEQKRLQAIELALDECFSTRRRQRAARDLHRFAPEGLMGRWATGSSDNNGGKSPRMARYLTRIGEDTPFAYALNRRDFLLVSDQKLWAHESHDWLLAADSGAAFAHRTGDSFYSVDTGEALFTQTASPYPES